jgi:prepilin-type N-terminal cleavage/methylation domain-containing protein
MGRKGFSLVELMIAVAIMAILTCIAYPMYTGYLEGGKRSEATTNLEELRLLEEEYRSLNGDYGIDGTYAGLAAIQGYLPEWQPPLKADGVTPDLKYNYYIQVANGGNDFIAGAIPGPDAPADPAIAAPVANTVATIDQNNARQGANFW